MEPAKPVQFSIVHKAPTYLYVLASHLRSPQAWFNWSAHLPQHTNFSLQLQHIHDSLVDQSILSNFDRSINHVSIWSIWSVDQDQIWLLAQSCQTLIKFGCSLNHFKLWSNLVDRSIISNFDQIWLIAQSCQTLIKFGWSINHAIVLCKDNLQE